MKTTSTQHTLRALHLFSYYLSTTENWLFNLINHLPNTHIIVASQHFFLQNFYSCEFEYLEFPVKRIMNPDKNLALRLVNSVLSAVLRLYPYYVARVCGKCDLMHSHFAVTGWTYMRLAKRLRIPHIVSLYGFDYESVLFCSRLWQRRYRRLFHEADMFLCEGQNASRILQRLGCPREKIRVARLGVDVGNIPFWTRQKKRGELRLLQIASAKEKKGHKHTLEAFKMALRECPNMTLTFVGLAPRDAIRMRLERDIKDTAADGKVFFLNGIDFSLLHAFMRDYQVFIHPSCYSEERDCEGGAPIVLLDAQATGMPVIATTHCDIPDEVVHGSTGLLCREKDPLALAESIRLFYYMDRDKYECFARDAREHVKRTYDASANFAAIRKIYDDVIQSKK